MSQYQNNSHVKNYFGNHDAKFEIKRAIFTCTNNKKICLDGQTDPNYRKA